jgi:hypothetical protein
MRNMLGGLLAAFIGSLLLVYIFDLSQPAYPQEVIAIWALLVGSHSLSQSYTIFLDPFMLASYLLVWLIMLANHGSCHSTVLKVWMECG